MTSNAHAPAELPSLLIPRCLRHLTDNVLEPSSAFSLRMFRRGDEDYTSSTWRGYGRHAAQKAGTVFWVAVIYLGSELLIWGLSLLLRPARLHFLSSILGMALVFAVAVVVQQVCPSSDSFYHRNVKSKVDFINSNLGLGFPVPIVMISRQNLLGGAGIGRVIGNFLNTNIIFWTLAFLLSWAILAGVMRVHFPSCTLRKHHVDTERSDAPSVPHIEMPARTLSRRPSEATTLNGTMMTGYHTDKEAGLAPDSRTVSAYFTDSECPTPIPPPAGTECERQGELSDRAQVSEQSPASGVGWTDECYPIVLAVFSLVVVGIPVSHSTGDDRILDGCMLWLTWISSTRLQRRFGRSHILAELSRLKTMATTLLNPVLLTTLAMTAYTRAKATATHTPIEETLAIFSSGTPLSDLWTFKTTSWPLRRDQQEWFGAGDAALSILECGIVVWGFKLYECRKQIWSRAGASVVLISVGIAALNVFLSVLLGKAVGLGSPEALAFATRSTTLALARPAMDMLRGNQVVNAALVVSNGILGQLMYPFLLRRLRIEAHVDGGEEAARDEAPTIGAGTAIGINGAAMGVAYLYERKSRAAPYAALSMTVFGVMTVVFTSVHPFTGILVNLARG